MKKILYTNGDSFVFGMECISDKPKSPDSKQLSFPKFVADGLGCTEYINNAFNGATNDFICRNTIFDLQNLEKQGINPADVFVIIGITSLHRIEIDGAEIFGRFDNPAELLKDAKDNEYIFYPTEYEQYGTIFTNPGMELTIVSDRSSYNTQRDILPFCARYLWTEPVQLASQEARIILLHEYLKLKGYSHVFVNTVCPLERTQHLDLNCKNFYNLDSDAFWLYANRSFPNEKQQYNHFSSVPHKEYSNILLEYIKNNNL